MASIRNRSVGRRQRRQQRKPWHVAPLAAACVGLLVVGAVAGGALIDRVLASSGGFNLDLAGGLKSLPSPSQGGMVAVVSPNGSIAYVTEPATDRSSPSTRARAG